MHKENQTQEMPLYGNSDTYLRLSKCRAIFLAEDITKESASSLSALLLHYDNESNQEDIYLYIHSSGGDAAGLVHIYDVMQMISAPIKTICLGKAYSAAAVLLASGSAGERYAMKHAKIMIHGIQCNFPILGDDQVDSKNYYEFLNDHNDSIMRMLAKHTKHPLNKIKSDCTRDVWLNAKEALEFGLIDAIIQ